MEGSLLRIEIVLREREGGISFHFISYFHRNTNTNGNGNGNGNAPSEMGFQPGKTKTVFTGFVGGRCEC